MQLTIRSAASRVNHVVGPMVMLIGIGGGITAVVLAIALDAPGFLALFLPVVLALGGGAFVLWGARRSRLRIDGRGFRWCGFLGKEQSLRWEQLHQLLPPAPDAARTVAIAQLRDGNLVEVRALWEPAMSPTSLLGGRDHSAALGALITAHRAWLAEQR